MNHAGEGRSGERARRHHHGRPRGSAEQEGWVNQIWHTLRSTSRSSLDRPGKVGGRNNQSLVVVCVGEGTVGV